MNAVLAAIALAALALAPGCADSGKAEEQPKAATQTWSTLTATDGDLSTCQLCHSSGSGQPVGGLYFTSDQYAAILAATSPDCTGATDLVVPSDKTNSVFYLIANGDARCSGFSPDPMPGAAAVAADIGAWIDAGAPQ
jgi:hypothetical protein